MKKLLSLVAIVVILSLPGLGVKPAAAIGPGGIDITVGCDSVDMSGPAGGPTGTFEIFDLTVYDVVGSITFVNSGSSWTGHGTFKAPVGHILETIISVFTVMPCTGDGSRFAPGDGRVDPQPGDRVAVWCQTTGDSRYIDVWGVLDDSSGKRLGLITYAALKKAGGSKTMSGEFGTVTLTMSGNRFLAAWFGGPAFADGSGSFRKVFTCNFS